MTEHDAEVDASVTMLEGTGLIEECTTDDGKPALRLTARGASMDPALAIAGDDAEATLAALLGAQR